ncbi:Pentatricopeptide repeat-containing protein [Thalictrum thalictroides]|uniref:Pentatricopeptide repeat-containing protein n=1 Tax=Thalictrum thalictroides TaxID=46969 RepID=A0A7J6V023_THATH|nr:Pentatricopeptide repeat-containing protein [Thalictrum thalictroides]
MAATIPKSTYLQANNTSTPNHVHNLAFTLQTCKSLSQAKQIHACILRNNVSDSEHFFAKLLLFCTSSPATSRTSSTTALDYALLVFEQQLPSIFMWNTMIRGYANSNYPMRAIGLYIRMREQGVVQPNNYTFTFLIKACAEMSCVLNYSLGPAMHAQTIVFGIPDSDVHVYTSLLNMYASIAEENVETARKLFDRMKDRTAATWNSMISAYTKRGNITVARELFDVMPNKNEKSWNVMVCGYTRSGEFDVAGRLFNYMPIKTLPTWNAMIAGYTQASRPAEALTLFHQMQLAGVRPDEITVVSILPSCAQLGALELGEWVHLYVKRNKFNSNTTVCNALIDMYAKCGCIDKAMDVFKGMRDQTVVTWNTLISGLAIHGQAEEAIALFTEMETKGVMPDAITFVGLLNACAHAGSVDKAWAYFKDMQMVYGIRPKIEHYGCMVDVLGRTHHLNEALSLIDSMPLEPNSVVLGSLLSACRTCNDSELGEKVLERLVQLEPLNPGYYVLLSNMYASARRWEDVTRVRNLMKSRGIGKSPGCSSIEMNNTVHEFVVGDKTHPQTQEIYRKLDEISLRLESAGYVPDTSIVLFDLDEEEKAQNLSVHSEKLVVAFALLNTHTAKPIRVVKNLRVCRDCHLAIKLISKEYGREIVLRDCNRFHHFKDGVCSCKEFW